MRGLIPYLLLLAALPLSGQGRNIFSGEYFWDADPGIGNGTALAATDGTFDEMVEGLMANVAAPLVAGPHTFNIRIKESDGQWSPLFTTVVVVAGGSQAAPRAMNLLEAEYFWDTDPGEGNGTSFPAADGSLDETVEALLAGMIPVPASPGPHTFSARVRDIDGQWSTPFTTVVTTRVPEDGNGLRDLELVAAEYFWNADPGEGNATPFAAADGALDESVEALLQSGIAVPGSAGPHTFNVRVQDADGGWSSLFTTLVHSFEAATPPSRGVIAAEYFWDADPGQGNGTPLLAFDGSFGETVETVIANSIPTPGAYGPHLFSVRVLDADNHWSPAFSTVVTVDIDKNDIPGLSEDTDGDCFDALTEYYLGTDPDVYDKISDVIVRDLAPNPGAGPDKRLLVEFGRNPFAEGVDLHVEMSPNLVNWFSDENWVTQTVDDDDFVRFFSVPSVGDEPRLFNRVRFELSPP